MTCNLLEVERDNEIHGLSYAEKFKTVLVENKGLETLHSIHNRGFKNVDDLQSS